MSTEQSEPVNPSQNAEAPESADQPVVPELQAEPASEAEEDNLPPVQVEVEDLGALRKRLKITVPAERIDAKRNESITELSRNAQVPGFRIGRAPRRLIEKRFGTELKQDLKTSMIAMGYSKAVEQSGLKVLGDPELSDEKIDAIQLPESGPLSFDVDVEVQPDFELPALENIPVVRPDIAITDAQVDRTIERMRTDMSQLETVGEPARADDILLADMTFQVEGEEAKQSPNSQIPVRPRALEGIPLEDLDQKLAGATAGQTLTVETTVPAGYPQETLCGKKATFTFAVKEVRRRRLPDLDAKFLGNFGFDNVDAFRVWVREGLVFESERLKQRDMRNQITRYLLGNVKLDLPEGVLGRMKDRALARRANELLMQGVARADIEKHMDELTVHAGEEAAQELKTLFVIQRVAEKLDVQVSEQEVNALIAQIAGRYNRRPDNVRLELERRDGIGQLVLQIREQKALDQLLEKADVKDAQEQPAGQAEGERTE